MSGDAQALLLQMMAGQGGAGPASSADALLAQLGQQNPTLALLARYMAERRAEAATPAEAEEVESEVEADPLESRLTLVGAAQNAFEPREELDLQEVRRLRAECARLREDQGTLAEALGACAQCWGSDPHCRSCEGHGTPGGYRPNPQLFQEIVLPAVRRIRLERAPSKTKQQPAPQSGGAVGEPNSRRDA